MALWDSVEEETLSPETRRAGSRSGWGRGGCLRWGQACDQQGRAAPGMQGGLGHTCNPGPAWEATSVLLPLSWAPAAVGIHWQWSAEMAGHRRRVMLAGLARELQGSQKLWSQRQMARGLQRGHRPDTQVYSEGSIRGELERSGRERRRARMGLTGRVDVQAGDSHRLSKETSLDLLLRPGVGVKAEGGVRRGEQLAVQLTSGPGEAAVGGTSLPGWHPPATCKLPQSCSREASGILESLPSAQLARSFGTSTFMAVGGIASIGGSPIPKSREAAEIQKGPGHQPVRFPLRRAGLSGHAWRLLFTVNDPQPLGADGKLPSRWTKGRRGGCSLAGTCKLPLTSAAGSASAAPPCPVSFSIPGPAAGIRCSRRWC